MNGGSRQLSAALPHGAFSRSRLDSSALLRFCVGAMFVGCAITVTGVSNFGMILAAAALLAALFALPAEYAIVAVAFGPLMLTALRAVDGWYGHYFRWIILFLGVLVCIARVSGAARSYTGPSTSIYTSLVRLYVLAAVGTIVTSFVPALTALKALTLIAMVVFCETSSRWLAEEAGPDAARRMVRAWVLFTLPCLVLSTLLWLRSDSSSYSDGAFLGTTGNTNSFGALVAFLIPLLASRFLGGKIRISRSFLLWAAFTLTIIYLLYISRSRASLLAFVVSVVVGYLMAPRSDIFRIAVSAAVMAVLFAFARPGPTLDAFQSFVYKGAEQHGVLGSRINLWEASLQDFMDNPLMGIGYGITDSREEGWEVETATRAVKEERGSSPLAVLSQVGLLGGIPFLSAVLIVAIRAAMFARRVRDPWLTGIVASVWAGITNSLFEGWMTSVGSGLLWLLLTQCYLLDAILARFRPPRAAAAASPRRASRRFPEPVAMPAGD